MDCSYVKSFRTVWVKNGGGEIETLNKLPDSKQQPGTWQLGLYVKDFDFQASRDPM